MYTNLLQQSDLMYSELTVSHCLQLKSVMATINSENSREMIVMARLSQNNIQLVFNVKDRGTFILDTWRREYCSNFSFFSYNSDRPT